MLDAFLNEGEFEASSLRGFTRADRFLFRSILLPFQQQFFGLIRDRLEYIMGSLNLYLFNLILVYMKHRNDANLPSDSGNDLYFLYSEDVKPDIGII